MLWAESVELQLVLVVVLVSPSAGTQRAVGTPAASRLSALLIHAGNFAFSAMHCPTPGI